MTSLQQYQLWIGLGFVALLVVFFIVLVFSSKSIDPARLQIIRFLSALCAGFAGALLTGDALFRLDATIGAGWRLAASGSAGVALFMFVWTTFKQVFPESSNVGIPEGWTFQAAVDAIVKQDNAIAEYAGFKQDELSASLRAAEFEKTTVPEVLMALRSLAGANAIRRYTVTFARPVYELKVKED